MAAGSMAPALSNWRASSLLARSTDIGTLGSSAIFFGVTCSTTLTVLYPNEGLNIGLQRDRDWAVALARAYNDWAPSRIFDGESTFSGSRAACTAGSACLR